VLTENILEKAQKKVLLFSQIWKTKLKLSEQTLIFDHAGFTGKF